MEPDQSGAIDQREQYQAAEEYVVKQLGKHASRNDIIFNLTQVTGSTWEQASAFVEQVERERHSGIALRRAPILLLLGIPMVVIGLYSTVSYIGQLLVVARASAGTAAAVPLVAAEILPYLAIRLAMVIGGAWGIWIAISDIWKRP